jgi:hypothetical protein
MSIVLRCFFTFPWTGEQSSPQSGYGDMVEDFGVKKNAPRGIGGRDHGRLLKQRL